MTMASLSDSSMRQYDVSFKKWWEFCRLTQTEILKAGKADVLRFLSSEFDKGASYGSINSMRSAVALLLGPEIGQDPNIKRFCSGASRLRPAQPKYDVSWDPKIVLKFLGGWFPNEKLALEKLSLKLVTLLALTTGHRMQTLASIDIRNIRELQDQLEIKIPAELKTSKRNRKQPSLVLPVFKEDTSVCVVGVVKEYLKKTVNLRGGKNELFISWRAPHKAVTAQTLSRWIKTVLKDSGVDTDIFTAYSTRHASTSTVKSSGVSIDLIRSTAGWTAESKTFAKFYDRPIVQDKKQFAQAVLSKKLK